MSPPRWQITCIARLRSVLAEVACMDWLECTVVRVLWLACLLASFPMCISPRPPIFALLTQTPPLVACVPHFCARPICSPFSLSLSRYPSLPFLSLACSRRIVALYLLLEAFAFSVFGWWDSDIDEGGGGERESQQQQQQQQKGGSFCLLDT